MLAATATAQQPVSPATVPASGSDAADLKLVQTVCGGCHARNSMLGTYRTRGEWEQVLDWMVDEGAVMSDDEYARVLGFVAVEYGRVDVNTASGDDIRSVLEVTEAQAARVVAARGRAPLKTFDALASALGVTPAALEPKQKRITFESD